VDIENRNGFADAGNSRTANGLYFHSECNRFYAGENRIDPLLKLSVVKMACHLEFTSYSKQQQCVAAAAQYAA